MDQTNSLDSKFRFAIIVAKRAKQLINGAKQLVDLEAQNPLTIAIEEVRQGLVTAELLDSVNIYLKESSLLDGDGSEVQEADEAEMELPLKNEETGIELVKEEAAKPEEVETKAEAETEPEAEEEKPSEEVE